MEQGWDIVNVTTSFTNFSNTRYTSLYKNSTALTTSPLQRQANSAARSAISQYISVNASAGEAKNLFETDFKPRLDAMNIDEEYRTWVEEQFKSVDPESYDFMMGVLNNMEKYVDLSTGSIADAKTFHLGDHGAYQDWASGWTNELSSWLNSGAPGITEDMRDQAEAALEMLRIMEREQTGASLSTSDIIAAGHIYKGDSPATDPNEAFNTAFTKQTGTEIGEDIPAFFAEIFGKDNGGADFVKGIYESRFNVAVTEDGQYVGGVQHARPGQGLPYQYVLNEETNSLEGSYYLGSYPPYHAALSESFGFDVELDHNNVPIVSKKGATNSHGIQYFSVDDDNGQERIFLTGERPFIKDVTYVNPDADMNGYTFNTNRENRDKTGRILTEMMNRASTHSSPKESMKTFLEEMNSYFGNTYPLDNGSRDVFAYAKGKNYHPSQDLYKYLQYSSK